MFAPRDVVCSLQGNFNSVRPMVQGDDIEDGRCIATTGNNTDSSNICSYDIVTAFTVEEAAPHLPALNQSVPVPIRGILTTRGCIVPDRTVPNRHTVYITSGSMQANDTDHDRDHWKAFFGSSGAAAADEEDDDPTTKQQYQLDRPQGGHGVAWIDTLYCDATLRVVQGHRGSIFVLTKMGSA
jgi:hypothetical protein